MTGSSSMTWMRAGWVMGHAGDPEASGLRTALRRRSRSLGMEMVKFVPWPASLWTAIRPSCSLMMA